MNENESIAASPPLDGVRVVEIAQNIAVPYCGRLLAAMGAEVIKVEPPAGDAMRHQARLKTPEGAPPEGQPYAVVNANKKSVVIDLGRAESADALDALVRWADVVLVAVKPPDIARYGLDEERLRSVNRDVIVLDHRPFGPDGPYGQQGGYDVLMQGLTGMAISTGRPAKSGQYPQTVRPAFNDFGTGMLSALGVVVALRHRDRTGVGQRVTTSLLATALNYMSPLVSQFDQIEERFDQRWAEAKRELPADADFEAQRLAYEDVSDISPAFSLYFRHFQTADSFVSIGALSAALQIRFHAATEIPSPQQSGARPNDASWWALVAQAEQVFRSKTTATWLEVLRDHGVPASRFNLPHQALDDPQVTINAFRSELHHESFGGYRTPACPIGWSETPARVDAPSPILDADTDAVLRSAGLDPVTIATLRQQGVIGPSPAKGNE